MARPLKSGLDYFPLDVSFDDPVELVEAECGMEGLAILIKLWQKIYANGYFIEWSNDTLLLFAKKINTDKNNVSSVINTCLLRNLFSAPLYEKYGILTSSGIQKRYVTACVSSKRKTIVMEERYLLLEDKYKKLITELIPFIQEETPINSGESTQRKGKESKRKESKVKESNKTALEIAVDDFIEFRKKIKAPMTERAIQLLMTELNKLSSDDETKIAIINQSIVNSWKGVFPLKDSNTTKKEDGINDFKQSGFKELE